MTGMNDATRAQVRAAEPSVSTWVSANAGSGKTRVLTDRVARLLLGGADPGRILCLTYTKAAAAEMQNRLFDRLGAWAMMPNDALRAALRDLGETGAMDDAGLRQARRLFANALETPGGLKIQTIHAFCDKILRQFPLEAGVSPQFEALQGSEAAQLRAEILDEMAEGADADAVAALARELTGAELDPILMEIADKRDKLNMDAVRQALGQRADTDWEAYYASVGGDAARDTVKGVAAAMMGSAPPTAEKLAAVAEAPDTVRFLLGLESELLYGATAASPFGAKRLGNKTVRVAQPALFEAVDTLAAQVADQRSIRADARLSLRTERLTAFAEAFLARYDRAKLLTGRLDFSDLIRFASGLLESSESAQWVLYRLDGGIDHILVDEAQDTSPDQWRIVTRLAEEFTAGEGQVARSRTLFVVGDEKQSIYSFQGADPAVFSQMRDSFSNRLQATGQKLEKADLVYSFRSADPILRLVDTVFDGPAGENFVQRSQHLPFHTDLPGRVDLWPFREKETGGAEQPWYVPLDTPDPADPRKHLADTVAQWIAHHLSVGTIFPGKDARPLKPKDFLILVQRRGPLFTHVIKALKKLGVPVAGADRLRVGEELAVRDVLSLLRWADLQDDDLSLAEAMRSPLLGFTEGELFALSWNRRGPLWQALRESGGFADRLAILQDVLDKADFLRPFELIDRILTHHGGRERLLARLGEDCEDALDELLAQALRYEQNDIPSLSGFLNWFARETVEVKREMDSGQDQVRVMTVHGAKGLEAPVVVLPDTAAIRGAQDRDGLAELETGGLIWKIPSGGSKAVSLHQMAASDARKAFLQAERMRLLYVAMTRAERWLVVAGAGDRGKDVLGSWYNTIEDAMQRSGEGAPLATMEADDPIVGPHLTLRWHWEEATGKPADLSLRQRDLPDWAKRPAPDVLPTPLPIRPSSLPGAKALPSPDGLSEAEALQRGTDVHLLLEHLPGVSPGARHTLVDRLLPHRPPEERGLLLAEASRIVDDPELAWLFVADALAEVPVTGTLPSLGGQRLEGVIDRLIVGAEVVTAVDFKTNAGVPARVEDTPPGILAQLAAYAEVLAQVYPAHRIDVGILWTAQARYVSVPHKLVSGHLAALGAS